MYTHTHVHKHTYTQLPHSVGNTDDDDVGGEHHAFSVSTFFLPCSISCISAKLLPCVSGNCVTVNSNARTQKTENNQNAYGIPTASVNVVKNLVNTKHSNQQNDAVTADAIAFKCDGNISAIITQTNGPKPVY